MPHASPAAVRMFLALMSDPSALDVRWWRFPPLWSAPRIRPPRMSSASIGPPGGRIARPSGGPAGHREQVRARSEHRGLELHPREEPQERLALLAIAPALLEVAEERARPLHRVDDRSLEARFRDLRGQVLRAVEVGRGEEGQRS